jgi:probable rRNA maturation factor
MLIDEAGDWRVLPTRDELVARVAAVVGECPSCARLHGREANIVLADDAMVRSLNRTYRGKDAATNVLSFPFAPSPGSEHTRHLGDIVLALETVVKEATEQGIPLEHHFQHLVVHGLLHLIGFDHVEDAEAIAMEQLEARLLAELGVPAPYASTQSD